MCSLLKASHTAKSQKMQAGLFFAEANPKLVASSIVAATLLGAGVMNLVDTKSLNADYIRERTSLLSRNEATTRYNAQGIAELKQNLRDLKEEHKEALKNSRDVYKELHVRLEKRNNKLRSTRAKNAKLKKIIKESSKDGGKVDFSDSDISETSLDPDVDGGTSITNLV